MSTKLKQLFVALFLGLLSTTAVAEKPPFVQDGTLGKYLEDLYSQLMQTCLPERPKIIKRACRFCPEVTELVSAVPAALQNQSVINLNSRVLWNDRQSLARTFALVYPDPKQFGKPTSEGQGWLLYQTALESSAGTLIPAETSSGMVMHDCGAALTALAEANAGLEMPVGQFRSALKASYTGGTKTNLAVFFGQFNSPFFKMWNSSAPEEHVLAMMWLYDWYSRAKYNNEYLLSSINVGLTAFNVDETNRDSTGKLDVNGAINAGIVAAKANTAMSANSGVLSKLRSFKVAIPLNQQGQPDVKFEPLPSPKELAQRMRRVAPQVDESSIIPAVPGSRTIHKITIRGVPPEQCSDNKKMWRVNADDPFNAPSLVSNKPASSADGAQVCEFVLEYAVPGKYAAQTEADEFVLTYSIRGINQPTDHDGTRYDVEFDQVRVRYPVNRSPEIFTPLNVADPAINGSIMAWKSNLIIREDSGSASSSIDWTKTASSTATIICGGDQPLTATSTFDPNPARKTGEVNFTLHSSDNNQLQNWRMGLANLKQCSVRGAIKFPTKQAGVYLVREYSMPINFPGTLAKGTEPQIAVISTTGG
ncbi:hypothetical protein [Massilia sp.]|uniref:hypothetical protein n=1 Tax=Massilia sp. TaxID=1882437 RepID=UPI00289B7C59|nr:hypothetical protein [Massilia sp.]